MKTKTIIISVAAFGLLGGLGYWAYTEKSKPNPDVAEKNKKFNFV